MASWWQGLENFFGDMFAYMRQASMSSPMNHMDSDPSLDWIIDFVTNGPPAPSYTASDEQIKKWEYMFSHLPGYGEWVRARDNFNWMADYLKNNNMKWEDMLYPSRASGSGSGADLLNFTSRNIEKLYKHRAGQAALSVNLFPNPLLFRSYLYFQSRFSHGSKE